MTTQFWAPGFWAPGFWAEGFWGDVAESPARYGGVYWVYRKSRRRPRRDDWEDESERDQEAIATDFAPKPKVQKLAGRVKRIGPSYKLPQTATTQVISKVDHQRVDALLSLWRRNLELEEQLDEEMLLLLLMQ